LFNTTSTNFLFLKLAGAKALPRSGLETGHSLTPFLKNKKMESITHDGMHPSNYELRLNGKLYTTPEKIITGAEALALAGLEPADHYELLLKLTEREFEPVELEEKVELEHGNVKVFEARLAHEATIFLDDEPYPVFECFRTPVQILALDRKKPEDYYLKQILGHRDITYKDDMHHEIAMKNHLRFSSCKKGPTPVS